MTDMADVKIKKWELRRRHQALLAAFKRLNDESAPWMCSTSQNDADTIISMTNVMREAISVYCWNDQKNWTALTVTKVAGKIDDEYREVPYERGVQEDSDDPERFRMGGSDFWVPTVLKQRMIETIAAVLTLGVAAPSES